VKPAKHKLDALKIDKHPLSGRRRQYLYAKVRPKNSEQVLGNFCKQCGKNNRPQHWPGKHTDPTPATVPKMAKTLNKKQAREFPLKTWLGNTVGKKPWFETMSIPPKYGNQASNSINLTTTSLPVEQQTHRKKAPLSSA
jgi:hypothetical protein